MGNGKNLMILIVVVIVAIMLSAAIYFATVGGIIETVKQVFADLASKITESGIYQTVAGWFGVSKVENSLPMYIIDNASIAALKSQLESQAIVTEKVGLTEVRLRKILLANSVTMSFSDTLSAAALVPMNIDASTCTEEQSIQAIVDTLKLKYPNENINTSNFTSYLDKKESKDVWPIDNPNYDLYYEKDTSNDVFFYFKDSDGLLSDASNAKDLWYIGAMGATTITAQDGTALVYYDEEGFKSLKEQYEKKPNKDKEGSAEEANLLNAYTKISADKIKVYNINVDQKAYNYIFENKNIKATAETGIEDGKINLDCIDETSTYTVTSQEISLSNEIDMSSYAIPIELMIDMLTVTGSGEFVEEFIDYALTKVQVFADAYTLTATEKQYYKTTYEIKDDFIVELYDVIDYANVDNGHDNFKAYKDIIFDRMYAGSKFNGRITEDIADFETLDFDGLPAEGDVEYNVPALEGLLKTAYNPKEDFDLDKIEVTEIIEVTRKTNNWQVMPSNVKTWYGAFNYTKPTIEAVYTTAELTREATETEYNEYTVDKLELDESATSSDIEMEDFYITATLATQGGITEETIVAENSDKLVDIIDASQEDIYNDALATLPGGGNASQYRHWNVRGLANIAVNDNGEGYNNAIGAGEGCDYVYSKYTKTNIQNYKVGTKSLIQTLDTSNVKVIPSSEEDKDIDSQLNEFLKLLKNQTGEIPSKATTDVGEFSRDGTVVKYGDIYRGQILVGDLLLDNGAEIMFELLEASENTQGLVNVFKYLAYRYTGRSYGITDASQIGFLFSTISYGGADFVVDSSMSSEYALTKEQLIEAIEKTYSGQTKTNLLNCVDDFMYIQQTNNVNAVFGVAVTIIESSGGADTSGIIPATNNWMSVTYWTGTNATRTHTSGAYTWCAYDTFQQATRDFGSYISNSSKYFKAGNYSVKTIAPTYCDDNWGNDVVAEMTKIYNSIGISVNTGGIEGELEGITTLTVGDKTYKNFKQINPSYKSITLANYPKTTLYKSGCAVTSVAIIASAYNVNITPVQVNNYEAQIGSTDHPTVVEHYTGLNCSWVYGGNIKIPVVNQLKQGYPTIVHVKKNSGKYASSRGHFFTILSISDDGNYVYVSDPASNKSSRTGWQLTTILDDSAFDRYMKVSQ